MKGIIRSIKQLFGIHEPGHEYWVYRKDIKVDPQWRKTLIGKNKWKRKKKYYYKTGELQSRIVLRRSDWQLVDGYSSLRIAEIMGIEKVPVWFVD